MNKLNKYSIVYSSGKISKLYARTKGDAEIIAKIKETKETGCVMVITKCKIPY
jgi:hypothetical protein